MKHMAVVALMSTAILCGCQKAEYNMQGVAGDIGDAMEHCRGLMKHLTLKGTRVSIDALSSRETAEYYDIYLDLSDTKQDGYGQCTVDMQGKITYYVLRDFRQKSRSFAGF